MKWAKVFMNAVLCLASVVEAKAFTANLSRDGDDPERNDKKADPATAVSLEHEV
jgi:hypothetical protein